ncbi:MAG: cytidine deaminase [Erysipelotrichaceae bacterium]|nr:cytidine deaminase [Erysipelotrichaceae bacterium]
MNYEELIRQAMKAREAAYAPYSHWKVGAALLCADGKIYLGCNIENSGFTATICAERTAIFKAVSEGERDFKAIAIVGGSEKDGPTGYCAPCGVCRQVMSEFCDPDRFAVINAYSEKNYKVFKLRDMLPEARFVAFDDGYGFSGE